MLQKLVLDKSRQKQHLILHATTVASAPSYTLIYPNIYRNYNFESTVWKKAIEFYSTIPATFIYLIIYSFNLFLADLLWYS